MIAYTHDFQKMKSSNQVMLFGSGQLEPPEIPAEVKRMEEWEQGLFLAYEKEALGFYLSSHPLAQYGNRLKGLVTHTLAQVNELSNTETEVNVAGIISTIKLLKTRKDDRMATFVLEDMSSRVEVVAFPDSYRQNYEFVREDLLVWLRARLQGNGDSNRLQLVKILPLEDALQHRAKRVILRVNLPELETSVVQELKILLGENAGECPVFFELDTDNSCRLVVQSVDIQGVTPTERLSKSLEDLLGENTVFILY
jgi:DNA polymerase-3 subunit alpha